MWVCPYDDQQLDMGAALAGLTRLKCLKRLDDYLSPVPGNPDAYDVDLRRLPMSIEVLHLRGLADNAGELSLAAHLCLSRLTALTQLHLARTRLAPADPDTLTALARLRQLA